MGWNPSLEQLHCFQENRIASIITDLTLTLGVNRPLWFIYIAVLGLLANSNLDFITAYGFRTVLGSISKLNGFIAPCRNCSVAQTQIQIPIRFQMLNRYFWNGYLYMDRDSSPSPAM